MTRTLRVTALAGLAALALAAGIGCTSTQHASAPSASTTHQTAQVAPSAHKAAATTPKATPAVRNVWAGDTYAYNTYVAYAHSTHNPVMSQPNADAIAAKLCLTTDARTLQANLGQLLLSKVYNPAGDIMLAGTEYTGVLRGYCNSQMDAFTTALTDTMGGQ